MPREKMIEYITNGTEISAKSLQALPRTELLRLVHAKYFGDDVKQIMSEPAPKLIAMEHQLQIARG